MFMVTPVEIQAAETQTVETPGLPKWTADWKDAYYGRETIGTINLVNVKKKATVTVKSSNPEVATVTYVRKGRKLIITDKKVGKTVITVKVKQDGKVYKTKANYQLFPYQNPIAKCMIGDVDYKDGVNEFPWCDVPTSRKKQTISVKVKRGHKFIKIYGVAKDGKEKEIKNGSKIRLSNWDVIYVQTKDTKGAGKGCMQDIAFAPRNIEG